MRRWVAATTVLMVLAWAASAQAEWTDRLPESDRVAVRQMNMHPVGNSAPVLGLNGLPVWTGETDGVYEPRCNGDLACIARCEEMQFYRIQVGLDPVFDGMGFGESSCKNTIENSCCHGWWQIHERYWSNIPHCGITNIYDVQGNDAISKQKNACAAKHVFDNSGCRAWTTCPGWAR